jgi:ABC-2 type transport system permease protein
MTGFRVLLYKELLESWRTRRLPAVMGLFVVLGIISPLTARFLPEILKAALGSQLTVPIPVPTAADAVLQVQKNLGQLGAFAAIVLAMGAVAAEKERGTAAFILTKPASRGAFLGAKLAALGMVLALATLVSVGIAWAYTAILFEPGPIGGWVALAVLAWLALAAWTSITFLASTISGSSALAAGVGVVALIGLSLIGAIPQVGRFLPAGLDGPAQALASGLSAEFRSDELVTAVLGSFAIVAASAVAAWLSFRRQEL